VTTLAQLRASAQQWKLLDSSPVFESHTGWGPIAAVVEDGKVVITTAAGRYCGWGKLAAMLRDAPGELPVHIAHSPSDALFGTLPVKQATLSRGAALMMQLVR
jgi:hypothetical protein